MGTGVAVAISLEGEYCSVSYGEQEVARSLGRLKDVCAGRLVQQERRARSTGMIEKSSITKSWNRGISQLTLRDSS